MSGVFFQRAAKGYRAVRGEVIRSVQVALKAAGSDPGDSDGIYGEDTERAVRDFQIRQGIQATGKITVETWSKLMLVQPPEVKDCCIQLTGDFEGHGFQKVAGNFDNAGLTWGIIGFTLKHGEVQAILAKIREDHPALLSQAFGHLETELLSVLDSNSRGRSHLLTFISAFSFRNYRGRSHLLTFISAFSFDMRKICRANHESTHRVLSIM